jgi:hypothetical protein
VNPSKSALGSSQLGSDMAPILEGAGLQPRHTTSKNERLKPLRDLLLPVMCG